MCKKNKFVLNAAPKYTQAQTLSFANAALILAELEQILSQGSLAWDLEGTIHADSSILSIFTALRRQAKLAGSKLEFYNIPAQVMELVEFNNLSSVLK